jgi:zona occludens toxin
VTVSVYLGPVGSGKSYCALARTFNRLRRKNGGVVANFDLTEWNKREMQKGWPDRWHFVPDDELTPDKLIRLSLEKGWFGHEGSAWLLIDEAAIKFNSRDWQATDRVAWIKFLNHSRKFGYDVILVTQAVNMLDKQIREACEFRVKHVNLKRYKWMAWLPVRIFLQVSYWQAGAFKGNVTSVFFSGRMARRYDTMAVFDKGLQEYLIEYGYMERLSSLSDALQDGDSLEVAEEGEGPCGPPNVDASSGAGVAVVPWQVG